MSKSVGRYVFKKSEMTTDLLGRGSSEDIVVMYIHKQFAEW